MSPGLSITAARPRSTGLIFMIFGADVRRLCLLFLCLLAIPAAAQTAWGLPQLMQSLAQIRSATARLTERQTSPVLSTPLISAGTLTYVAPDYLRKTTTSPRPEVFTLVHGQVTLTGADGTHVFSLNQEPRIAGLLQAIRGTLAGDLPALEQYYTLSLTGTAAGWQLQLLPKGAALQRFLRAVTISGTQAHIGR